MPSPAADDYLKTVFAHTEWQDAPITPSQLAAKLGIAPSSVTEMVKKLAAAGLVSHVPYGAVRLTAEGEARALQMVRRHRLIETFLVRELDYGWDEVHDEAEILEHVVSDKFVDRIAAHLGDPVVDPHGDPIPTREGAIVQRESVLLSEAEAGTSGVIVRVNDTDPELLRYLTDIDIGIGRRVRVVERLPFAGSIRIGVRPEPEDEEQERALGLVAAEALWISPDEGAVAGG